MPVGTIGLLGSANALGIVVFNTLLGRRHPRWGWIVGQVLVFASALVLWLGTAVPLFVLGYFLRSGIGVAKVLATSQVGRVVDEHEMGLAYAVAETAGAGAVILAPVMAGLLYERRSGMAIHIQCATHRGGDCGDHSLRAQEGPAQPTPAAGRLAAQGQRRYAGIRRALRPGPAEPKGSGGHRAPKRRQHATDHRMGNPSRPGRPGHGDVGAGSDAVVLFPGHGRVLPRSHYAVVLVRERAARHPPHLCPPGGGYHQRAAQAGLPHTAAVLDRCPGGGARD